MWNDSRRERKRNIMQRHCKVSMRWGRPSKRKVNDRRSFELLMNEWFCWFCFLIGRFFFFEKISHKDNTLEKKKLLWWRNADQDVWQAPSKKGVYKKMKPTSTTEHISFLTIRRAILQRFNWRRINSTCDCTKYDINFRSSSSRIDRFVTVIVDLRLIVQIFCVFY